MGSLEFFNEIAKNINPNSEEITIVGNKVEENLFNARCVLSHIREHFLSVMEDYSIDINVENLEQFSFQPADGVIYKEDKFMIVYSGGEKDCFLYPEVGVINPHDDYCVNHFFESGRQVAKFYDLDIENHTQPALPKGSKLITHWGQGVSANPDVKDVYFLYPDAKFVSEFLKLPRPYVEEIKDFCNNNTFDKVFGLTYNTQTLEPLKLKLYYYPNDPKMADTVFDEINV